MKENKLQVEEISVDLLKPAEYNPRYLSNKKFEDIKDSLEKFGFVDPVIVNNNPEREFVIIGGHQRAKVAKEIGIERVPVVYLNLTLEEEKELNVRLNKNVGEWDFEVLKKEFDNEDLIDWGFSESDIKLGFEEIEKLSEEATTEDKKIQEKKYPIIPKYNEKYATFMIFCNNELDVHWMRNFLKLTETHKDYKSNAVGPSHVITATDFQKIIEDIQNV